MSTLGFKKAERRRVKMKIAITGPSGSGKTYSALLIAKGLARKPDGSYGPIAVIDTENDSASLYAGATGMPEFDTLTLSPPFHTQRYLEAIKLAVAKGYSVLVIDSISHQWSGEGGIMDRLDKERMAKPSLNSYTAWAKYTPEHETFKSAIVQSPIHIVATMRSKQEYALDKDEKTGKSQPRKIGMAPVQRDQFEYEFTTVLDLSMEHFATASKDRTSLFDGGHFRPTEDVGVEIQRWLETAREDDVDLAPPKAPPAESALPNAISEPMYLAMVAKVKDRGFTSEQVVDYLDRTFGKKRVKDLTKAEYDRMWSDLEPPMREPGDDSFDDRQQPMFIGGAGHGQAGA